MFIRFLERAPIHMTKHKQSIVRYSVNPSTCTFTFSVIFEAGGNRMHIDCSHEVRQVNGHADCEDHDTEPSVAPRMKYILQLQPNTF